MQRLTIERLAVWILFILLFAMAMRVPLDTDTWWHLRSGQVFMDEGSILTKDIFSHTRIDEEWVNHSWGSQIVLYGAYKLTGGDGDPTDTGTIGLALFTALLATGGMAIIYRMCAGNVYSRMFVLVIGAATAAAFWSPRPQMFSFVLSTLTLYIIYLYKYKAVNRIWFIPILMIVWVNLHAGFAIGFIFLFGFMIGEAIGKLMAPQDEHTLTWQQLRNLGIATLIGIVALSINPFGPQMIIYPFRTAGIQVLNLFIQEWRSPDFKNPQTWPYLILLGTIIVMGSRTRQQMAWSDLTLVAGTAALALWSSRNLAVFAVVATPVLSRQIDAWLTEHEWQIAPAQDITPGMARLNWLFLGIVVLGALAKIGTTLAPENVKETHTDFLPVEAVTYLQEHQPPGPIFNDYNWGGYFIFVLPEYQVFVDGRTDLYGDDFLKSYIRAILGAEEWREPLDDYDINLVVVQNESALATLLRENPTTWSLTHEDEMAIIFERQP